MATIIGVSGSIRRGSYNSMLLRAAAAMAPAGTTIETTSIRDIPLHDGEMRAAGPAVRAQVETFVSGFAQFVAAWQRVDDRSSRLPRLRSDSTTWRGAPPGNFPSG